MKPCISISNSDVVVYLMKDMNIKPRDVDGLNIYDSAPSQILVRRTSITPQKKASKHSSRSREIANFPESRDPMLLIALTDAEINGRRKKSIERKSSSNIYDKARRSKSSVTARRVSVPNTTARSFSASASRSGYRKTSPIRQKRSSLAQLYRLEEYEHKQTPTSVYAEEVLIRGRLDREPVLVVVSMKSSYSLIDKDCVHRAGLSRYVDKSITVYVNGERAKGHIHSCFLTLDNITLEVSLIVVDHLPYDIKLGQDTLKSYRFCIDMARDELLIGKYGRTPILSTSKAHSLLPQPAVLPHKKTLQHKEGPQRRMAASVEPLQHMPSQPKVQRRPKSKRKHEKRYSSTFTTEEEREIMRLIEECLPRTYAVPLVRLSSVV